MPLTILDHKLCKLVYGMIRITEVFLAENNLLINSIYNNTVQYIINLIIFVNYYIPNICIIDKLRIYISHFSKHNAYTPPICRTDEIVLANRRVNLLNHTYSTYYRMLTFKNAPSTLFSIEIYYKKVRTEHF